MQNSNQVLRNIFDNLYFHVKSQVKREKNKNSFDQFMQIQKLETWCKFDKLFFHAKSKVKSDKYHRVKFHNHLRAVVIQNPKFYIGNNFDNLQFHAKSQIKSKNDHKIKCDTSLKSYDHAEFNKFDKLYLHSKSKVTRKTTTKNKSSTSLRRSGHLEFKIGDLEEI